VQHPEDVDVEDPSEPRGIELDGKEALSVDTGVDEHSIEAAELVGRLGERSSTLSRSTKSHALPPTGHPGDRRRDRLLTAYR